jgi:hypothetical protein
MDFQKQMMDCSKSAINFEKATKGCRKSTMKHGNDAFPARKQWMDRKKSFFAGTIKFLYLRY